jgi:hypothetical protein
MKCNDTIDEELKSINSETVKLFSDFILSFTEYSDVEEYNDNNAIKEMIIDLITSGFYEIISFDQMKNNSGDWVIHSRKTKRIIKTIQWISDNLDVWKIKELPEALVDETLMIYNRRFLFTRKDFPDKQLKS